MEIVSAGESLICVFITVSFLSTNAIPLEDEESPSSITFADQPRHKKDVSDSGSTELVQAILPVQVDAGNLVSGFNDHIDEMREDVASGFDEMRENMTNLDEKLEILKANEARQEKENAPLIEQLKSFLEKEASAKKSWGKEKVRLIEQLKVCKENESRVEEENARLIEQLKVSKENETKARNASKNSNGRTRGKFVLITGEPSVEWQDWEGARRECVRWGGDLASRFTDEDLDFIFTKVIPKNVSNVKDCDPAGRYIIGGRVNPLKASLDRNYKPKFEWLDVDDRLWERSEPRHHWCMNVNRNCTRKDGTSGPAYQNHWCSNPHPFICQFD